MYWSVHTRANLLLKGVEARLLQPQTTSKGHPDLGLKAELKIDQSYAHNHIASYIFVFKG